MQIEYTQDNDPCQTWYIPTADFRVFGELAQIQYTDFLEKLHRVRSKKSAALQVAEPTTVAIIHPISVFDG